MVREIFRTGFRCFETLPEAQLDSTHEVYQFTNALDPYILAQSSCAPHQRNFNVDLAFRFGRWVESAGLRVLGGDESG
jgi:hypothetical protein